MTWQAIKRIAVTFLGTTLLFSAFVGLGTSLALLISSCIGYLPYSDRPGPGWWGHPHWPALVEITTYLGFAPAFAYFSLFFGLGFFGLALVLGFASAPRWLSRVLGALLAGAAAVLAVAGGGWYFALAPIFPDVAGIIGLLYGTLLFPRFIYPRSRHLDMWARTACVAIAAGLLVLWMAWPFIPRTPPPQISFDLIRLTPGNQPVTVPKWQGQDVARETDLLNLRGVIHGGIGGPASSSEGGPEINVELIALESITSEARLHIPKEGYVVYVLQNGRWTPHPSVQKATKHLLIVEPGSDPRFDGGRVQIEDQSPHAFTWYPGIPKGH